MLWREVSEFKISTHRGIRVVAFDRPGAPDTWWRMNRRAFGTTDFIMAHAFDAPIEQVCATLNAYRSRALEGAAGDVANA